MNEQQERGRDARATNLEQDLVARASRPRLRMEERPERGRDARATNLALLLTPPGVAGLAVVRASGPGVGRFLGKHFSRPTPPGRCVHGELADANGTIDDPVVVLAADGASVDLNLHGGEWIVQRTLDLLAREGFEVVQLLPDEPLPRVAVDAADELEASVLAHLPLATTRLGIDLLLRQIELWKDFRPTPAEAATIAADAGLWHLLHPPRVALVGRPNVGKSTLANRLFGRQRSIVADRPGTTRDWVGEGANLGGLPVVLIDTPGRRASDDPIERDAIAASEPVAAGADLVIVVVDASTPPTPEDRALIDSFAADRSLVFLNKCDRPVRWPADVPAGYRSVRGAAVSDVSDLVRAVLGHFGIDGVDRDRPRWWTAGRREALRRIPQ